MSGPLSRRIEGGQRMRTDWTREEIDSGNINVVVQKWGRGGDTTVTVVAVSALIMFNFANIRRQA